MVRLLFFFFFFFFVVYLARYIVGRRLGSCLIALSSERRYLSVVFDRWRPRPISRLRTYEGLPLTRRDTQMQP